MICAWYRLVLSSWGNNPLDTQGAITPTVMLSLRALLRAARLATVSDAQEMPKRGPSCAGCLGMGCREGPISSQDVADYLQSALMMEFMPPNEGAAVAKILKMAGFTLRCCSWIGVDMFCCCCGIANHCCQVGKEFVSDSCLYILCVQYFSFDQLHWFYGFKYRDELSSSSEKKHVVSFMEQILGKSDESGGDFPYQEQDGTFGWSLWDDHRGR